MTSGQLHLTEDEMDEALMGAAASERAAHLKGCALCTSNFERFNSAMADFNQASVAWSEAKSNALSRDLQQHQTPFRISAGVVWSSASAMVLAVALFLGVGFHLHTEEIAASQANLRWANEQNKGGEADQRGEIASDDAMLRQIDAAINTAEPSPEALYGLSTAPTATRQSLRQAQAGN